MKKSKNQIKENKSANGKIYNRFLKAIASSLAKQIDLKSVQLSMTFKRKRNI